MNYLVILLLASAPILSAQGLSSLLGGSNAKKIQGVAVKASLGCTNGQILKYVSANSQFECADDSGGSGAGDVEGGTNLTTAGAIPYVSSSGTLSQDSPALHWDATNNRLGLGTATPGAAIDVGSAEGVVIRGTANLQLGSAGGNQAFLQGGGKFGVYFGTSALYINATTLSSGIGPSNTSPTGTLHVYDATASTGDTIVNIRDGAAAAARINFAPNGSATADAGLRHVSANNLAITDGSSTTYWTLGAGGILAGADNTYDIGASGANRPRHGYFAGAIVAGGNLNGANAVISGDVIGASTSCIYLGATGTDGSWRWCRSGNNSVMERRESGSWVTKQTITP